MINNRIILGTVQFGMDYGINNPIGKPSKQKVYEILEYAASEGIKEIDTADSYGVANNILGNFNETHPDLFEINTKFTISQGSLVEQLEHTLNILKINIINTYFYHSYSDLINSPDTLLTLVSLKNTNRLKKIGVSVYGNSEFKSSIEIDEIDVIQIPFNLLDNKYQRGDLLQLAKTKGKEIHARSVFLQGLFFMPVNNIPAKLNSLKLHLKKIRRLSVIHQMEIEELSLLYVLGQSEIDKIIIGVDNMEQLKKNLELKKDKLSKEILNSINSIIVQESELLYPKNWN